MLSGREAIFLTRMAWTDRCGDEEMAKYLWALDDADDGVSSWPKNKGMTKP